MLCYRWTAILVLLLCPFVFARTSHASETDLQSMQATFANVIQPLVASHCSECHNDRDAQAEINLTVDRTFDDVRRRPSVWMRVREMLESEQMPPKESKQLKEHERTTLLNWVRSYLKWEATARAGDPGRIVLRRLNNAEYKYTVQDLTGVLALDPTREFPGDNAAGEGFTNTGIGASMSPTMVTKYLDAAKEIANHLVLTPDAVRFSPSVSRRDWAEECLARIRSFYQQFTDDSGSTRVNLQGIQLETNKGGRLPILRYLKATMTAREQSIRGPGLFQLANSQNLSTKYLELLFQRLSQIDDRESYLLEPIRKQWQEAKSAEDAAKIESQIAQWQKALWKSNVIGHIIQDVQSNFKSPKWQGPVDPFVDQLELRHKFGSSNKDEGSVLYLSANDAGDGHEQDWVLWENPRFVSPGKPDLPFKNLRYAMASLEAKRQLIQTQTASCLDAIQRLDSNPNPASIARVVQEMRIDEMLLRAWMACLGIGTEPATIPTFLTQKLTRTESYDFIQGWIGPDALSVIANSSDQHVRVPGNMKPHAVAVHPSPKQRVNVGWRSPVEGTVQINGAVQHAHPECGNGVQWLLDLRRGQTRQQLATGIAQGATVHKIPELTKVNVRKGDLIVLSISPRDSNHSCDLTAVDLSIESEAFRWDLAQDNSTDILTANPHADRFGNEGVWNFFTEPDTLVSASWVVSGSLLDQWLSAESHEHKRQLGDAIQRLLVELPTTSTHESPNGRLRSNLLSLTGPLASALDHVHAESVATEVAGLGIDPSLFGVHPDGLPVDANSLCMKAPFTLELRIPKELAEGYEFVVTGKLLERTSPTASVQLQLSHSKPEVFDLLPMHPIVLAASGPHRVRWEKAVEDMRSLFPAALCYEKIVPVDEVVTLTLFYREDDQLQRLMLDDPHIAQLNRLWDELLYVSQEPILLAAAFEQLAEYATQDRPDKVNEFAPMRQPILNRADAFRKRLVDTEPNHVEALVTLASKAYRHDLSLDEKQQIRNLYASLRRQELSHEESVQLTLARILVSPSFLYKLERPGSGSTQQPINAFELATRLSYFLWSSMPDEELMRLARSGELLEHPTLESQVQRMMQDPKSRRLALEFACQWLHVRDLEENDQKSESMFPTFAGLRSAILEETVLFFDDMIRNNRPVLSALTADHTFLNESLAEHYGIPQVIGPQWRRVERVGRYGRGGLLGLSSALATQSGASRTSPILRGNWICEVLLGDRLPRPPKDVPQLPEEVPAGLNEREMIERHSSDPACAKCHVKIDPLGFSLEHFDAIGRYRHVDAQGHPINASVRLVDGTDVQGMVGLRNYLVKSRHRDFLTQFQRKLLGYALGRSVQLSDEPLLDSMLANSNPDTGIQHWIHSIVTSRQFREIRGQMFPDD